MNRLQDLGSSATPSASTDGLVTLDRLLAFYGDDPDYNPYSAHYDKPNRSQDKSKQITIRSSAATTATDTLAATDGNFNSKHPIARSLSRGPRCETRRVAERPFKEAPITKSDRSSDVLAIDGTRIRQRGKNTFKQPSIPLPKDSQLSLNVVKKKVPHSHDETIDPLHSGDEEKNSNGDKMSMVSTQHHEQNRIFYSGGKQMFISPKANESTSPLDSTNGSQPYAYSDHIDNSYRDSSIPSSRNSDHTQANVTHSSLCVCNAESERFSFSFSSLPSQGDPVDDVLPVTADTEPIERGEQDQIVPMCRSRKHAHSSPAAVVARFGDLTFEETDHMVAQIFQFQIAQEQALSYYNQTATLQQSKVAAHTSQRQPSVANDNDVFVQSDGRSYFPTSPSEDAGSPDQQQHSFPFCVQNIPLPSDLSFDPSSALKKQKMDETTENVALSASISLLPAGFADQRAFDTNAGALFGVVNPRFLGSSSALDSSWESFCVHPPSSVVTSRSSSSTSSTRRNLIGSNGRYVEDSCSPSCCAALVVPSNELSNELVSAKQNERTCIPSDYAESQNRHLHSIKSSPSCLAPYGATKDSLSHATPSPPPFVDWPAGPSLIETMQGKLPPPVPIHFSALSLSGNLKKKLWQGKSQNKSRPVRNDDRSTQDVTRRVSRFMPPPPPSLQAARVMTVCLPPRQYPDGRSSAPGDVYYTPAEGESVAEAKARALSAIAQQEAQVHKADHKTCRAEGEFAFLTKTPGTSDWSMGYGASYSATVAEGAPGSTFAAFDEKSESFQSYCQILMQWYSRVARVFGHNDPRIGSSYPAPSKREKNCFLRPTTVQPESYFLHSAVPPCPRPELMFDLSIDEDTGLYFVDAQHRFVLWHDSVQQWWEQHVQPRTVGHRLHVTLASGTNEVDNYGHVQTTVTANNPTNNSNYQFTRGTKDSLVMNSVSAPFQRKNNSHSHQKLGIASRASDPVISLNRNTNHNPSPQYNHYGLGGHSDMVLQYGTGGHMTNVAPHPLTHYPLEAKVFATPNPMSRPRNARRNSSSAESFDNRTNLPVYESVVPPQYTATSAVATSDQYGHASTQNNRYFQPPQFHQQPAAYRYDPNNALRTELPRAYGYSTAEQGMRQQQTFGMPRQPFAL